MKKHRIHIEEIKRENILKVPEGYFERVAVRMSAISEKQNVWATMPKSSVFVVPTTYFDELPERISKRLTPKESFVLEPIPPIAFGENVPQGYFDTLPMRIQKRMEQRRKPAYLPIPEWVRQPVFRYTMAMASLLLLVLYLLPNYSENQINSDYLADISNQEVKTYIQENVTEHTDELSELALAGKINLQNELSVHTHLPIDEVAKELDINDIDPSLLN